MNENELSVIEQAIVFATKAHSGGKRKGSGIPYIFHPLEAAEIVSRLTTDEEVIAATVLHDVLEDTSVTAEEITQQFGNRVCQMVQSETEDKRRECAACDTWKIRKQETIQYLKETANREEKMIALGDKLANLRAIQNDLAIVGESMWDRFNQKDKKMHQWYYSEVLSTLEEFQNTAAWKEFQQKVNTVFL